MFGAGLILSASAIDVSARPLVQLQTPESAPPGATAAPVGDVLGSYASISGDGKLVVYQGLPPVPSVGPVDEQSDAEDERTDPRNTTIYLSNREDGNTVELTPVPSGLRHGDSVRPVISGDGCSVVAITEMALDVFRDDDGGERWDVYRSVLPHCGGAIGNWELVSARNDGTGLARDDVRADQTPAVSRSGADVAYVHADDRLFDAAGVNTISLVDLTVPINDIARSVVVAGMPVDRPNTTYVHVGLDQPAISDDGRYVAYRSDVVSDAAVPVWGVGLTDGERATQQVFVWDRLENDPFTAVRLVSALPSGEPTTFGAAEPALSRDGRFVAFTSGDPGIVAATFPQCADACPSQIYRLDRDVDANGLFDEPGATTLDLISADPYSDTLVAGTGASFQPALSADGQLLAFISKAPNLQLIQAPGGGEPTDGDVLVADTGRDGLRRITVSSDGVRPTIGAHARPQLSDTGRITVFDTLAASQLLDEGAAPGRQIVSLSTPPQLSLADADVGTTLVGVESAGWFVGLVNDGPSGFQPAHVTIDDARFVLDTENSTCLIGTLVPSGSRCNVAFTFTPSSPAPVNATLTVSELGFEAVSVQSRLSGAGGEPALQIAPGGADLGTADVGQTATEFLFDVSNISFVPTSVSSIVIGGAHPDDFALSTNNCADRPLNPRASCAVGILFTPSASGRRTALVEVFTPEGQSTSVILAGDGTFAPALAPLVTEVQAGQEFILGGTAYPANQELTVVFGDGPSDTLQVTTNATGEFVAVVPVATNERGGDRQIVVQSPTGVAATAPIEVIGDDQQFIGMPGFGLGG
ncbi:MAG: choice-of-anchor D domain-containing protein [Ilumatobacter sp.]|nr:choice-of-anchor D domain-containing protein [Ilumatobacter sp.]